MVRLIDVANRAGVSLGAASVVLSGGKKSSIRVSAEKRERILAAAEELNYIPNISAQRLCGYSSHTIGVLVDSEDAAVRFRQLAAIEREADRRGYRLLIAEAHENPGKQLLNCQTLFQYGVDAVICHANNMDSEVMTQKKVVFFGAEPLSGLPCVYSDIRMGYAEAAAQFHREARRKTVLLIGEQELKYDALRARRKAFGEVFPEGKVYTILDRANDPESVREVFGKFVESVLIPEKTDAVIAQNDLWCMTLAGELLRCGKRIPQEISLVGQDNSEFCCCRYPALSTIDPNLEAFGKAVVELALERILHPETPVRSIAVPTKLILRETTQNRRQV